MEFDGLDDNGDHRDLGFKDNLRENENILDNF